MNDILQTLLRVCMFVGKKNANVVDEILLFISLLYIFKKKKVIPWEENHIFKDLIGMN